MNMKIEGTNQQQYFSEQLNSRGQGSQEKAVTAVEEIQAQRNPAKKEINEEKLTPIIDQANKSFEAFDRRFEFSIHDKTNKIMVKVIDSSNDEIIREVPPEKLVDMMANMLEVAGLLVDERI